MLDTIKGIQACQPHSGTPIAVPPGSRQTLWRAQSETGLSLPHGREDSWFIAILRTPGGLWEATHSTVFRNARKTKSIAGCLWPSWRHTHLVLQEWSVLVSAPSYGLRVWSRCGDKQTNLNVFEEQKAVPRWLICTDQEKLCHLLPARSAGFHWEPEVWEEARTTV